jgi:heme oxygenase
MTETLSEPTPRVGAQGFERAIGPVDRWQRLRAATEAVHGRLDQRIMAADPFGDRARYGLFLLVQHAFHRDVDALYDSAQLGQLLPDLAGRRRLALIERDLGDLGLAPPAAEAPPACSQDTDVPTALGWLYVAEGSNLGAAFLLKEAAKLDLSESFGARHLAPAPQGRGLAWRTFTAALDAAVLSPDEEKAIDAGAIAAFTRVHSLVETHQPVAANAQRTATAPV